MTRELDFNADTRTIRTWLNGGCVSTDALIAQLEDWADFWHRGNAEQEGAAVGNERTANV